jgi:pyruvate-formate lyase-activating enzyme
MGSQMKVYHIVYEPTYKSAVIHVWTECNLRCRGCYCNYETLDFGLIDNWVERVANQPLASPPDHFLSLKEVMGLLSGLDIDRVVFIGTEPSLDPELPALAKALHERFTSYNILLTNGVKLTDMEHIDEVIFSLKAVSDDTYRDYTGRSNRNTMANFVTVHNSGKKLQAECLLIPGYIDTREVENLARFVASVDRDIPLRIDGYFPLNGLPWPQATAADVERAAKSARRHLSKVNHLSAEMERIGDKPLRVW